MGKMKEVGVIVSVIVVARNEEKNIAACLDSLVSQDYPRENYEIIAVDGGSTDCTQEIVKRYPVRLIVADRAVIGYQRNIGAANAKGKYIAFTDADCVADRQWLSKLVQSIEGSGTDVVAVGGPNLVFESDPDFARIIGHMQRTFLGSGGSPQSYNISSPKYVYSIPNCNIAYVAEVLREEKYDNRLGVGDDGDINYRLSRKGYKFIYLPDAMVWHHRPASLKTFVKKMFLYGEAMGRLTRKNRGIVRWYAFAPMVAVLGIVVAYPFIVFVPGGIYVYISVAAIYAIGVFAATAQVARRLKSARSLETLFLLPTQHMSYGIGLFKGIILPRLSRENP